MRIIPHVDVFLMYLWEEVSFTSYYSAILIASDFFLLLFWGIFQSF